MYRGFMKKAAGAFLLSGLLLAQPIQVMGASKPINTVNVRVNSDLEPGGTLPDIEIGSGSASDGKVRVYASGKYHVTEAEWLDKSSKEIKAADEPRMKVTLEPEDVSEDYFLASYKASNVKISSGTFVSARRDGDSLVVTLRVRPVKGDFDPPKDAYWYEKNLGEARWDKPENTSGYYEVQLFRDKKSVYKVPKTGGVRYNFYPYMTEKGEYTFKVRTIPSSDAEKKYGGKSEWIESGELEITDRYVSDGKGQQKKDSSLKRGTQETVGWIKDGESWSYRYPDGDLCRGKWEYIEGQWYYFNVEGIMQTGWQNIANQYFYLYPNGQMATGWTKVGGKWYYFHTAEETQETEGSMMGAGWKVIGPYYYYFNEDGSIYTGWFQENGKRYYLNEVDNSLQGAMFTGWIKRDNKTYFADSNGEIVEGWCQVDGNWYYFYPGSGEMAYNADINGFHVNSDGIWMQ